MRRDVRRRLNQFSANPTCEANTRSAVHDIPMLAVAQAEGLEPEAGQSPFAIIRGQLFERSLFEDEAAALVAELRKRGALGPEDGGLVDLRLKSSGGPMPDLVRARDATSEMLEAIAEACRQGDEAALAALPRIVAGPAVQIPGRSILPDGLFALDLLVIQPQAGRVELRIGEVKVFPDRGGHTDSDQLAQARAQLGCYLYGLRLAVGLLGLSEVIEVCDEGLLVLTYPGTNLPRVRPGEDLRFQAARAEASFERLREAAAAAAPIEEGAEEVSAEQLGWVRAAATDYREACWGFCERAGACAEAAREAGDALALGESVAQLLGALTVPRALELLEGGAPETEAERDFLHRAREAEAA